MLSLRAPQKHRIGYLLVLFASLAGGVGAEPDGPVRVGVGDLRQGYESPDYSSRSAMLDPLVGERLALHELVANPPLGLPPISNQLNRAEVDLGRRLFFDRRLSTNGTLSCGMCHIPEQGFTQNEMATPVGIEGRSVRRNAPSLYNVVYVPALFLDGRETLLARQIWEPLMASNEMGNRSREELIRRIEGLDDYAESFAGVYGSGLTQESLGLALASYQQGLLSGVSRFDRWYFGNGQSDPGIVSLDEQERRGFVLFKAKGCSACHEVGEEYALFTNHNYYNTGIGYLARIEAVSAQRVQLAPGVFVETTLPVEVERMADEGRFEVTGNHTDRWRYRTPSLRNVALTAPYMHDGSLDSLAAVVDYYDRGGANSPNQNSLVRPLALTTPEKVALVRFLQTLTGSNVDALAADARSVGIGDAH